MKRIEKLQIRIVDGHDAVDCEERLNLVLSELVANKPRVERDTTKPFLFYVYYNVTETIPESKADQYRLDGVNLYCQDCPYFVVPDDRRLRCRCAIDHSNTTASRPMCDHGIEALEKGEGRE